MHYELYLPFPQTVNNYYQKSKSGGRFISHKGRKFRDMTSEAIVEQLPDVHISDKVLVEIVLFPPDNRMRDIDNYNKCLLDAITHAHLWEDDSLIDQLFNYRGECRPRNGSCYVRITDAGPVVRDVRMLPIS